MRRRKHAAAENRHARRLNRPSGTLQGQKKQKELKRAMRRPVWLLLVRTIGRRIEPDVWRQAWTDAESTLLPTPPRSLLVSGEPRVGKTSFLKLLGARVAKEGWSVF